MVPVHAAGCEAHTTSPPHLAAAVVPPGGEGFFRARCTAANRANMKSTGKFCVEEGTHRKIVVESPPQPESGERLSSSLLWTTAKV